MRQTKLAFMTFSSFNWNLINLVVLRYFFVIAGRLRSSPFTLTLVEGERWKLLRFQQPFHGLSSHRVFIDGADESHLPPLRTRLVFNDRLRVAYFWDCAKRKVVRACQYRACPLLDIEAMSMKAMKSRGAFAYGTLQRTLAFCYCLLLFRQMFADGQVFA